MCVFEMDSLQSLGTDASDLPMEQRLVQDEDELSTFVNIQS